jgi:hypothetical protein
MLDQPSNAVRDRVVIVFKGAVYLPIVRGRRFAHQRCAPFLPNSVKESAVRICKQYDAEVCVVVDKFENFIESRQLHISGFIDFYVKNHG